MSELPDWLYVGAPVVSLCEQGALRWPQVTHARVERIGKRDVVLDNGERFNVKRLARHGSTSFAPSTLLLPPDHERVARAEEQCRLGVAAARARRALDAWRVSGDDEDAQAVIDAVRGWRNR